MTEITVAPALVGRKAPEFEVRGFFRGEFRTYRLSDLKGKWAYLLFYPLDFTFVCPTEVRSFSRHAAQFEERDCRILGVSIDSEFVHKAWVETRAEDGGLGGDLAYPLLADVRKTMARDFGVLTEDGVALRGLFLIDPGSTVVHATINNLPVGRSAAEALRTLKAFQYVSGHEGEVCPADWDEGEDTMKADAAGMREYLKTH